MQVYVFDTYVTAKHQHLMHFDVFLADNNPEQAIQAAKTWLASIGETEAIVTSRECRYCHFEQASEAVSHAIRNQGYFIYKMEGCPQ